MVLAISGYRHASPAWLRWLLIGSGTLLVGRYTAMAVELSNFQVQHWIFDCRWIARFVGLTLPAVFAVDQLIRHPAITPKKLLRGYAVLLSIYLAAYGLRAMPGAEAIFFSIEFAFPFVIAGLCLMLMRNIPSPPIRRVLLILTLTYVCLGVTTPFAWYYERSEDLYEFVFAEMIGLVALWHAFETAHTA